MEARPVPRKLSPALTQPKRFKPALRSNSSTPSPLFSLHNFLRELFPGLPSLEIHTPSTVISAEIKAVVLTLTKARYGASVAVKKDMTRLEAIKVALVREEADIEGKMEKVERRMREVVRLHSTVTQNLADMRDKEGFIKEEKARLVKLAQALNRREAVLAAFASNLEEEKQRLAVEKSAFVATKEEWLSVHPSPPSPPAYRTPMDSAPASCDSPVFPH